MTVKYSVIVSCSAHFPRGGRNSGSTTDRVIADSRYSESCYSEVRLYIQVKLWLSKKICCLLFFYCAVYVKCVIYGVCYLHEVLFMGCVIHMKCVADSKGIVYMKCYVWDVYRKFLGCVVYRKCVICGTCCLQEVCICYLSECDVERSRHSRQKILK